MAGGPGMTPMRTPIRDQLGLNDPDMLLPAEASRREARARDAMEKNNLRAGLAGLPAPKNEYQIVVPEVRRALDALYAHCFVHLQPKATQHERS